MAISLEVDSVLEIRAGDRQVMAGDVSVTSSLNINKPNLFGGDAREGGIAGVLDVMLGRSDQQPNVYLSQQNGFVQPAYRGILGLVYRGYITSNNPYIKPWAVKARSILSGWENDSPWYAEKAAIPIGTTRFSLPTAIYLALDISGSMTGTKLAVMKEAVGIVLNRISSAISAGSPALSMRIVAWGSASTFVEEAVLNADGVERLRSFVNGLTTSGNTDAMAAYGGIYEYFQSTGGMNRVVICVSDGAMSNTAAAQALIASAEANLGAINMRGVGIQTAGSLDLFDNSGAGVPVVSGQNTEEMASVVMAALVQTSTSRGINPAHVIYQLVSNSDWGMGYPAAIIDDANFKKVADTLYSEGFGLCIKWVNQSKIREFAQIISDHVGMNYGQNRKTGKYELYPLRSDYDIDKLPVFNKSNCRVISYQRPSLTDTVNEIIIKYTDTETGKEASTAPLQNTANIMAQGRIISQTLDFSGIPTYDLAARVGERELAARSAPLWKFKLAMLRGAATELKGGEPFILDMLDDPDIGVKVILRGIEINHGTTIKSEITADCIEDVFSMPMTSYVAAPPPTPDPPDTAPQPLTGMIFEVPYRELIQVIGSTETAALPADAGYIGAVAARPAGVPMNYSLFTKIVNSGDYEEAGTGDFAPVFLAAGIVPREIGPTVVPYASASNVGNARVGDAAWIGTGKDAEMVRIDAIDTGAAAITLGRGCADTLPREWPAGTRIYVFDEFNTYDPEQYIAGEVVDAKILTNTSSGQQDMASATPMILEIAGRSSRPYLPAALRVNEFYYPAQPVNAISLRWVNRDRVTQADLLVDQSAGNIAAESGVTYSIRIENDANTVVYSVDNITGEYHNIPTGSIPFDSRFALLKMWSVRNGIRSFMQYEIQLTMPESTGGKLEFVMGETVQPSDGGNIDFIMKV